MRGLCIAVLLEARLEDVRARLPLSGGVLMALLPQRVGVRGRALYRPEKSCQELQSTDQRGPRLSRMWREINSSLLRGCNSRTIGFEITPRQSDR
jgi:hypothetical protein